MRADLKDLVGVVAQLQEQTSWVCYHVTRMRHLRGDFMPPSQASTTPTLDQLADGLDDIGENPWVLRRLSEAVRQEEAITASNV